MVDDITNIPYTAGSIDLEYISIVNYNGTIIEIQEIISEFNIYFDLFANHARISIVIIDSVGLSELMPLVGDEVIEISFSTPPTYGKFDELITMKFALYSIESKKHSKVRQDSYIINGVSKEYIANSLTTVQKTWSETPYENIIKDVYAKLNDYEMENDANPNQTLTIKDLPPGRKGTFYFSGKTPFDCIQYLANEINRSTDKTDASNYLFYQDHEGYQFRTLDSLIDSESKHTFFYGDAAVGKDDNSQLTYDKNSEGKVDRRNDVMPWQICNHLVVDKQIDTVKNVQSGLYKNFVSGLDPIMKRYTTKEFDYAKNYRDLKHTHGADAGVNIFTSSSGFTKLKSSENTSSFISHVRFNEKEPYIEQSKYMKEFAKVHSDLEYNDLHVKYPREKHEYYHYNIASKASSEFVKIHATVPGNSDLKLGDSITLVFSQSSQFEGSSNEYGAAEDTGWDENWLMETKFMVVSLRHSYNKVERSFYTTFDCIQTEYAKSPKEWNADWNSEIQEKRTRDALNALAGIR